MGFFDSGGSGLAAFTLGTDQIVTKVMDMIVDSSGLDDSSVGGKFDKSYVSGREYYAGLHLGFCHGPVDEITEISFRGKPGWQGVATPGADPIDGPDYATREPRDQEHPKDAAYGATQRTDPDLIIINRPELFGGESVEGGVLGIVEVLHGGQTQGVNSYLNTKLKSSAATTVYTPAYRGVLSMVFHSNITSVKDYLAFENMPEFVWGNSFLGTILQKNRSAKLSEPATQHTGFYWGAMTPSIKEVSIKVFRALQGWNVDGGCWYPSKCVVTRGGKNYMNPAHIAVQCLTDLRFGMKASISQIGSSFVLAADRFHHTPWVNEYGDTVPGEAFGLGIVWTGEESIRMFLNDVMRYIYGNVYIDPVTGLLEISLVRKVPEDQVANLPLFGPSQIEEIGSFSRPTGEESVNTVTIIYTQLETEKTESVTKSNVAMTSIYNSTINETLEMPGIKNAQMAAEVCEREVMQRCSLAATYTGVRVSRLSPAEGGADGAAFTLYEGAPFRLNWPPHGIVDQVFRATNIVQSTLEDNYIQFDAVEDAFALTSSQYVSAAPSSGWVDTKKFPDQFVVDDLRVINLPYVTVLAAAGTVGMRNMPNDLALFGVMADRDDGGITTGISVYTDNLDQFSGITTGQLCPTSELDGDLPIKIPGTSLLQNQVKVKNFSRTSEYMVKGCWFIVGEEKILCTDIVVDDTDPDYLLMTLERGIFDSVVYSHSSGAKMWWFNGVSAARVISTRFSPSTVDLYVTAVGRIGETQLASAPHLTPYVQNDWFLPYPPVGLKLSGKLLSDYVLRKLVIEWDCRNRVGQSDVPLAYDAGGVTSEEGVTYTVDVTIRWPVAPWGPGDYDSSTETISGIVVPGPIGSAKVTIPSHITDGNVSVVVRSKREGYYSTQSTTWAPSGFCGYGLKYGKMYGGASPGVAWLTPGVYSPTVYLSDPMPCPRPVWGADNWVHFDATLSADGQIGPGYDVPYFVTYGGGAVPAMTVTAEAARVAGVGLTSTAVLECARLTGPSAIYNFSEGVMGHSVVGLSDATLGTNYATQTGVDDFILSSTRVTNSITYDGAGYVFCFNYGADVYTAATDTFTAASVRKGSVGSPNDLGVLVRAYWIKKIGALYIACGEDLNDSAKTLVVSSPDLVTWTVQNASAPRCFLDKYNWVYYPPDSCWYVFGTVGDQVTGSTYGYKTTNGYTVTTVNLGCPANAPCIGSGYVFTDTAANWYMEVIAGPFLIRKFNTNPWVIHRSLRAPEQLALSRKGGIPFNDTHAGSGASGTVDEYQSVVRTGRYIYDSSKNTYGLGNQSKGALLGCITEANTTAKDRDYTLIQPLNHPYGNKIGALQDISSALIDGGFKNTGGSLDDIYGFQALPSTPTYFQVTVGKGTGEVLIGVVAALGPGEVTSFRTSALLQKTAKVLTDVRLNCPGGLLNGAAYVPASSSNFSNCIVGVALNLAAGTCAITVDGVTVATVDNLLYDGSTAWYPVFTSSGVPLSLNLGQKPFIY